ncbi:hypothetical protein [Cytophaga aurantiaca]|uniref:hypothetical protein n=1 Tax=Cytophaga aurantiaca TaxID=29530 RepID=UPI0003797BC1|nr:hypothetical protein [Cytophaga aurantiaca]
MKKQLFFLVLIILCFSCNHKNDSVPELTGKDYFPTDSGRYWIYNVHEIKYNADTTDTIYQRKDLIYNSFEFQNTTIYELYRFYKTNDAVDWPLQPDSVWSFTTDHNQITLKESNVEFIRLVFPLSNGETWNANSKNMALRDDYSVSNFGKPYGVNTFYFPQTVDIIEEHSLNLVYKDYRNRIYAKNVGLIYKNYEQLNFNTDPGNIGLGKIEFGSIIEESLIEYGTP